MLNHKGSILLESDRILLRPFVREDAEAMFKNWATEEAVTRYLTWLPHQSIKVTRDLLDTWCSHYTEKTYNYALVLKEINEPIGSIGVVRQDSDTEAAEFGYCMGQKYWGRGIMTEAMSLLFDYLFNEVGFKCIDGLHQVENKASGRVMQKLSMRYIDCISGAHKDNKGNFADCCHYSITAKEYHALHVRKANFHETKKVSELYVRLTDFLAESGDNKCGWRTNCYPTEEVAQSAADSGSLYIAEKSGKIIGTIILDHSQAKEYEAAQWEIKTDNPLIVHTLAIDPQFSRQGVAEALLEFAEEFAKAKGSPSIRLDTASKNTPAIGLYEKRGYICRGELDLGLDRGGIAAWKVFEKKL